jgi:hypothetical protein
MFDPVKKRAGIWIYEVLLQHVLQRAGIRIYVVLLPRLVCLKLEIFVECISTVVHKSISTEEFGFLFDIRFFSKC